MEKRLKTLWLNEGDKNTKFVHGVAFRKKRNNRILILKDDEDIWYDKAEDVENVFLAYFHNIFTTSNPSNMKLIF